MPEGVARGVGRVHGRGALVRSLRLLVIRAGRFASRRATTPDEQRWAARLVDRLTAALAEAADSPVVHSGLAAADRRAVVGAKTAAGERQGGRE